MLTATLTLRTHFAGRSWACVECCLRSLEVATSPRRICLSATAFYVISLIVVVRRVLQATLLARPSPCGAMAGGWSSSLGGSQGQFVLNEATLERRGPRSEEPGTSSWAASTSAGIASLPSSVVSPRGRRKKQRSGPAPIPSKAEQAKLRPHAGNGSCYWCSHLPHYKPLSSCRLPLSLLCLLCAVVLFSMGVVGCVVLSWVCVFMLFFSEISCLFS